jgi:hypothetical protein
MNASGLEHEAGSDLDINQNIRTVSGVSVFGLGTHESRCLGLNPILVTQTCFYKALI